MNACLCSALGCEFHPDEYNVCTGTEPGTDHVLVPMMPSFPWGPVYCQMCVACAEAEAEHSGRFSIEALEDRLAAIEEWLPPEEHYG